MLYGYGFLFFVEMLLLVYCVVSIITTPQNECRNLPKLLWLLLVVVLPLVGGIAWLVAGRAVAAASLPYQGIQGVGPRQPGTYRSPQTVRPTPPDDDAAFLRGLRERAEEQRRRAKDDGTP